jgi:hypothetical protein
VGEGPPPARDTPPQGEGNISHYVPIKLSARRSHSPQPPDAIADAGSRRVQARRFSLSLEVALLRHSPDADQQAPHSQ